jgi:hypothetical protein
LRIRSWPRADRPRRAPPSARSSAAGSREGTPAPGTAGRSCVR